MAAGVRRSRAPRHGRQADAERVHHDCRGSARTSAAAVARALDVLPAHLAPGVAAASAMVRGGGGALAPFQPVLGVDDGLERPGEAARAYLVELEATAGVAAQVPGPGAGNQTAVAGELAVVISVRWEQPVAVVGEVGDGPPPATHPVQ